MKVGRRAGFRQIPGVGGKKKGNGQRVGHRFRQARVGLGLDPIAAAWP